MDSGGFGRHYCTFHASSACNGEVKMPSLRLLRLFRRAALSTESSDSNPDL